MASHRGSIADSKSNNVDGHFFMRLQVAADGLVLDFEGLKREFAGVAAAYGMRWQLSDSAVVKRVVVLVSKLDHCLVDLLYRWRNRDFVFDIPCVISNHPDLRRYVEWHDIPFFHVPVTPDTKQQAFDRVEALFNEQRGDTIVLARYMQVLSAAMCERHANRIINIHHSFLPSFVGAKPYHQAYERGVKLVGATCHYVTSELDAGPIIEQDVVRISHEDTVEDVVRHGREVERAVLSRGVRYHVEDRVMIHGNKTVVFA